MLKTILLQAAAQDGIPVQFILLGGIAIVFYFFMMRPQQKKQKAQKKFIEEIKRGDNVITAGGIYGKVLSVDGDTAVIEIDKGAKMKISKTSISSSADAIPEKEKKA